MKILYVTTISDTINAFLIPHIEMLRRQGHQVDVACNEVQPLKEELINLGVKFYEVPFSRTPLKFDNIKAYKKIKKIIKEEKYDTVHTHTPTASTIVRIACKKLDKVKVIYTAHGFHFFKGAPLKNWICYYPIEKYLSKFTDILITINNEDYELSKRKFNNKKSIMIPGIGVDLKKFYPYEQKIKSQLRKDFHFNEKDFILTYVGELSNRKNQEQLLYVSKMLEKKIPNLKILLIGIGSNEEKLKQQVNKLKLNNIVQFLGFRSDIVDIMNMSDIIVSTSKQEGLPVNLLEGLSVGKIIVATNSRGNRDVVIDGYNGFLSDLNQPTKMADDIFYLYTNKSLLESMGENCLEEVKKYNLSNVLNIMERLYSTEY